MLTISNIELYEEDQPKTCARKKALITNQNTQLYTILDDTQV